MTKIIDYINFAVKHILNLILGILTAVVFAQVIFRFALNQPLAWTEELAIYCLVWITFLGGIVWSVWYYGKQIAHQGTFGNYFAHGFKTAAVITAIMILFFLVLIFAFPEFKTDAMEASRKAMAKSEGITQEQINQAMEISAKFFTVFLIGGTMLGYLFFGAIAALIGAGITKKDPTRIAADISQINQ